MVTPPGGRARHYAGEGLRRSPKSLQHAALRAARAVSRVLDPYALPDGAAGAGADVWQNPPVPAPDGLTVDQLIEAWHTWSVNGEPVGHLDSYVADSCYRFCYTWGLVRDLQGSCLELGSNPYFTTYLLDEHTDLDLTLANYYGERGELRETVSYVPPGATERVERERSGLLFNVEEDRFPYDDASFDVVLFCEMLEHLLMNPVAVLQQIHRVLRPGGQLVLTTPNVARLDNVCALASGANMYDPYSGFGPYGRHNREYTRHELHRLLGFMGFEVEESLTADGHPTDHRHWQNVEAVAPLVAHRSPDLGHYLYVRARLVRPPREGLPSFLYRSWPEGTIVD